MMSKNEAKWELGKLIENLQSSRYNEGWINRHQFTLTIEAAYHHNPENRKYAAQAIRLGENQFGRDWNSQDEVYYHAQTQATAMRQILSNIVENL